MYTNTSCTLYLKSNGYKPLLIPHCFYTETSISSASKTGLDYTESAACLFKGEKTLAFDRGHDFLIEGNSSLAIDATTEKGLSEGMKALQKAGAKTIMRADYKGYGSAGMRHWELSCK